MFCDESLRENTHHLKMFSKKIVTGYETDNWPYQQDLIDLQMRRIFNEVMLKSLVKIK